MSFFIKPWTSVAAVFLVWGIGAASGWFGHMRVIQYRAAQNQSVPENALNGSGGSTGAFEEMLIRKLQLTSDQESKIHQIMLGAGDQARSIRLQIQPQMHALRVTTLHEIQETLDPTQRAELSRLLADIVRRRRMRQTSGGAFGNQSSAGQFSNPGGLNSNPGSGNNASQERPLPSQAPAEYPLTDPAQ